MFIVFIKEYWLYGGEGEREDKDTKEMKEIQATTKWICFRVGI